MELTVKLTLSDRLFVLLEDKLPNLGRRFERAVGKEFGAQVRRESSISVSVSAEAPAPEAPTPETPAESEKPRRTRRAKAEAAAPVVTVEAVADEEAPRPEAPEQKAESEAPAEAPAQQPEKKLTTEDIRAAIHRTRQRFEGKDYKENANSEGRKKYHDQLSVIFLQIAAALGADKPSKLPADRRAVFIDECEALILDDNGSIVSPNTILND